MGYHRLCALLPASLALALYVSVCSATLSHHRGLRQACTACAAQLGACVGNTSCLAYLQCAGKCGTNVQCANFCLYHALSNPLVQDYNACAQVGRWKWDYESSLCQSLAPLSVVWTFGSKKFSCHSTITAATRRVRKRKLFQHVLL